MSRLVIFLSLYFCIFGLLHLYLLVKTRRAFYFHGVRYFLLAAVLLFLMMAPIQARMLEAQGYWLPSLIMAWIGFLWLGFTFIFVCLALPMDGYHLIVRAAQGVTGADWTAMMLSRRQSLGLVVLVTCALMIYGAFEAGRIDTQYITLPSSKIPPSVKRLRLVQISDLHIGPMTYPGRMAPIIKAIGEAEPDILVSTGDLVDGNALDQASITTALRDIPAPMGKFAVLGNHEYYHGLDASLDFSREAGFTILQDRTISVNSILTIAGVDDAAGQRHNKPQKQSEAELLSGLGTEPFILLLKHRPQIEAASRTMFDLQLSGHTHAGQIFPFGFLVRLRYSIKQGLTRLASGSYLYTSRGTGTWGPPIRILAPPEITVIDLVPDRPASTSTAN